MWVLEIKLCNDSKVFWEIVKYCGHLEAALVMLSTLKQGIVLFVHMYITKWLDKRPSDKESLVHKFNIWLENGVCSRFAGAGSHARCFTKSGFHTWHSLENNVSLKSALIGQRSAHRTLFHLSYLKTGWKTSSSKSNLILSTRTHSSIQNIHLQSLV